MAVGAWYHARHYTAQLAANYTAEEAPLVLSLAWACIRLLKSCLREREREEKKKKRKEKKKEALSQSAVAYSRH